MARLIDADKLVRVIKWWQEPLASDEYNKRIWDLLDSVLVHIDAQPTAYDIDKVIRKLKATSRIPVTDDEECWLLLDEAIEIVKGSAE